MRIVYFKNQIRINLNYKKKALEIKIKCQISTKDYFLENKRL